MNAKILMTAATALTTNEDAYRAAPARRRHAFEAAAMAESVLRARYQTASATAAPTAIHQPRGATVAHRALAVRRRVGMSQAVKAGTTPPTMAPVKATSTGVIFVSAWPNQSMALPAALTIVAAAWPRRASVSSFSLAQRVAIFKPSDRASTKAPMGGRARGSPIA